MFELCPDFNLTIANYKEGWEPFTGISGDIKPKINLLQ